MKKSKIQRIVITSVIVLILLGYLVYATFSGGTLYYKTVSEIINNAELREKPIRVSGKVVKGTFESRSDNYTFNITDGKNEIALIYQGVLPNSFKEDAEVIAEGIYTEDELFEVKTLLVKCPSKYVPQKLEEE